MKQEKDSKGTVTIPVEAYDRLKALEARIDEVIANGDYLKLNSFMAGHGYFWTEKESEIVKRCKKDIKDMGDICKKLRSELAESKGKYNALVLKKKWYKF